jgi:hypothetical protein
MIICQSKQSCDDSSFRSGDGLGHYEPQRKLCALVRKIRVLPPVVRNEVEMFSLMSHALQKHQMNMDRNIRTKPVRIEIKYIAFCYSR